VTTAGSANVTGFGLTTFFTKDFNVGSTVTVNGNSYTVATITNDYTMSFTTTVPTAGTYPYTITGNTDRFAVYKNGGVLIKGALGQVTNALDIQNSSSASIFSLTPSSKVSILKSGDSTLFNSTGRILGGVAPLIMKTDDGGGYMAYREFSDFGYQYNYIYTNGFNDECRLYLGNARGTYTSPTSLLKNDRVGGIYFHARGNGQFNKTAVIRVEVDSIYSGDKPMAKIIFGVDENNNAEVSSNWRFIIKNERNISIFDHEVGANLGVGLGGSETVPIEARLHVKGAGTTTGKTMLLEDNGGADILTVTDNKIIQAHGYSTYATTASALSKTESTRYAAFATDGTVVSSQIIRDTLVTANTSFTVGTLLNTCQELHVTMSVATGAVFDYSCTLPTPSATLRGKRVTLYSMSDVSGLYSTVVDVTGGASSLYYTTNTGSTAPSDQASLSLDGSTWPNQGATYTFTCKLIDANYRWVLEQR